MEITKDSLYQQLMFNLPVKYSECITLNPVKIKDILLFQVLQESIIVRKNSTFPEKAIIKMSYLEFLAYAFGNIELEEKYKIKNLSSYFIFAIQLLQLCLSEECEIKISEENGNITVFNNSNNIEETITPDVFDDMRRIIIIQNDIDFDIDEFLNYDTEMALKKAKKIDLEKNTDKATIEDYIDSLVITLHLSEDKVMNMTIRKFWRYIKRYQLHETYTISKTGECSGMVSFKEPIKHWMTSLDDEDAYSKYKTDENSIKGRLSEANG